MILTKINNGIKETWKEAIIDYFWLIIGTFILAIGLNIFLVPFKLSSGGISSIATILFYTFDIPLSVTNLIFNAVLFIVGYKYLGGASVVKTIAGIILLSFFLQLSTYIPCYKEDLIIGTIVGGILVGVGVGVVVNREGSTGGSDFAALILHKLIPHISVASFIWFIDCSIIILAGIVFDSITITAYSALSLFISTKISDFICTRGNLAKAVYIMSTENEKISLEIMDKYERGVTGVYSRGMYSQRDNMSLFCVVAPKEVPSVLKSVKKIDPKAFTVISDAREVFGEGFQMNF